MEGIATKKHKITQKAFRLFVFSCAFLWLKSAAMPVSMENSRIVYSALKRSGVKIVSALPETWLVHLINMAEADPDTMLVRLTREEEAIGISAGAHLAGVRSALLMQ